MKKKIHPENHKNVSVLLNKKEVMKVDSTREKIEIEIWSGNHPFYTGKETLVDTDNLVDKFNKKQSKSKEVKGPRSKTLKKLLRRKKSSPSKKNNSLKSMLKDIN